MMAEPKQETPEATTAPPILQVQTLGKAYQSQQGQLAAVEDVSFQVSTGEFLCVVGPSGSGKTTLLRMLAGLLAPDRGQVLLAGRPLTGPSQDIGLVFQKANLMPWRTVLDNVLLPLQVRRTPDETARRRAAAVLAMVGLDEFVHNYPRQLSGGMQQRVAIARALVYEPTILLLDEPFGALDALTRERLNLELLRVWAASGATIVMVTHDIREAVFLADRVIVLSSRPGRVARIFTIPFPRPRRPELLYDGQFSTLAYQVRQAIT